MRGRERKWKEEGYLRKGHKNTSGRYKIQYVNSVIVNEFRVFWYNVLSKKGS